MEGIQIETVEDIAEWEAIMAKQSDALLATRGGQPWWCLIDLQGFSLNPKMAPEYGTRAKGFMSKYFYGCVRFNVPQGLCSKSALRLGAIKNRFPSNMFEDQDAAQIAIESMKIHAA